MDIKTLIDQAEAHVEAGRPDEAHRLYTRLLQAFPRDIELILAVAKVYSLIGRPRATKQLLLRAITLDALNIKVLNTLARFYLRVERNREAARELLEQVLSLDTANLSAWLELGHIHAADDRLTEARACYSQALALDLRSALSFSPVYYATPPQSAAAEALLQAIQQSPLGQEIGLELLSALNGPEGESKKFQAWLARASQAPGLHAALLESLVQVALACGRLVIAQSGAEALLRQQPDDTFALGLKADVLLQRRSFSEARDTWARLLSLEPERSDALVNYWVAEIGCARQDPVALCTRIVDAIQESHPDPDTALTILAGAAKNLRQPALEESLIQARLQANPDDPAAMQQLAGFYFAERRNDEAIAAYEAILDKDPDRADIYANLLNLSTTANCPDKAAVWVDRVAALDEPGGAILPAYNIAKSLCLWDEAAQLRARVLDAFRSGKLTGTTLIGTCFSMLGDAAVDNDSLFAIHLSVAEGFRSQMKRPPYTAHPALHANCGKMRIGYVSGDFATHVVNGFFSGLINHCDRSRFEIYCYSTRPEASEDHVSQQYRLAVDKFINVAAEDDATLARRIYDDGIHVLVDLAGYTAYGRISVFTYSPAPVQMTYLGYSYSTGVAEVDYIIADPFLDGPRTSYYCAEKPLRLGECFMNFGEVAAYPLSDAIPFDSNGYITFGTMNKSQKMNPEVIALWSRVLAAVPGSRMLMKRFDYALERTRERIWREFEKHGIERDRVRIVWLDETPNYLDFYTTLDLALDPFPFTGATTTMETLRMGVPLITLVGDAIAQRNSYAVMNNAGLDLSELYAFSEQDYIDKAVALANNPERIRVLHKAMPEAIHNSSLVRPERFARQMEAAFEAGWNRKYPQHRWGADSAEDQIDWVGMLDGGEIAVPASSSDLFGYVIKEQGRWFDADWFLAVGLAPRLGRAWEVSADPGVYILPMARQGIAEVHVWSLAEASADLLRRSVTHNHLDHVSVASATRTSLALPWENPPDWLRLGPETGWSASAFVASNRAGLASAESILLLPVGARDWLGLVRELATLGYAPYSFIPGLSALAPFGAAHWDTFTRNLFFIKEARAGALADQGVLATSRPGLDSEPPAEANYWHGPLSDRPYSAEHLEAWQQIAVDDGNRAHFMALNLYALAQHEAAPLSLRLSCLEKAADYAQTAVLERPGLPRLLTAARILADAGRRSKAVQYLNQLVALVTGTETQTLDEPYLCLEPTWEQADPGEARQSWLFAMILATGDKWRAHSTRFTGLASLPVLDRVIASGWMTPEVVRRAALIRERFHLEADSQGDALPLD